MQCSECLTIFETIGHAFNAPIDTGELLRLVARTVTEHFSAKACHIRLISRDRTILENVASHGLSRRFLDKGPVDPGRSVAEAMEGRTVLVSDCTTDPRIQYPEAFADEGIVSLLSVPLKTRGQVIGVMRLSTAERREFTRQEIELAEVVASFCASAVLHSMFHSILRNVSEAVRSPQDLGEVLRSIVRVVAEDLHARGAFIQLEDPRAERLTVAAAFGLSDDYLASVAGEAGDALRQARRGTCVAVLEAAADPRVSTREAASREDIGSLLHVPLINRGTTLGVLTLCTNRPYEFSDDELYLMSTIGEQCALAVRNAQMYSMLKSRYDDLVEDFHRWFDHATYDVASASTPTME